MNLHENLRKNKINKHCLGFLIFLLPGILLFSCTQEHQSEIISKGPEEESPPVCTPTPTITPSPSMSPTSTPTVSPSSTPYSTSTLALLDISKVPERARMLVKTLTKKEDAEQEWYGFPEGVMYHDIHIGNGKAIKKGMGIHTILRGILEDGTQFVNTMKYEGNKSFVFTFGIGDTLKSFEQGISSMRERGKRVIVIPPELAYGEKEYESQDVFIPPNSILIFEVSVMWVREPEWEKIRFFK
jgi:peptidylprolyl isomerase